jgi:NAD(P)H-dependent flavin oxidoreductase YrpB (nitropropane dioxygenase family)
VTDICDLLQIEHPVVQAGMGGGISGAALAGAVSAAGGLGTVGIAPPEVFAAELRRVAEIAGGRPVSANLLMPFARRAHVRACVEARVAAVSLFFGFDRRAVAELHDAGIVVMHQVGTVEGARRALADGADVLIAQGREAGGHLLAEESLEAFLPRALEVAAQTPVLAAGGIVDRDDVRRAVAAGAAGVWCGTRFLLTDECAAHPAYKERVLAADRTVETKLFGTGWPARHRVVPNAATERWGAGGLVAGAAGLVSRASRPLGRVLPLSATARMTGTQRLALPLYSPAAPLAGMDERLVDVTPLYAGEAALRVDTVVPAAEAVARLTCEPSRP